MPYAIFDYISIQGRNEFKIWSSKLQKTELAKLNQKIDKLEKYGDLFYPNFPADSSIPGILKIKITAASVQLRPLLCRGPIHLGKEFTFLCGAKERGSKWHPQNALESAQQNKSAIIANPKSRRVSHERVR